MTNWLERAKTVFRNPPEPEPSIAQDTLRTNEESLGPELPILPKSAPAVSDDGGFSAAQAAARWVAHPATGAARGCYPPGHRSQRPHTCPSMPSGVRLVSWEPMAAPVRLDVCSVVFDVPKFIESELRALDSRLNNPWTIHGGFTVPQMLDRLAQAGLEVELNRKAEHPTKCQNTEGGREIK